MQRSHRQLVASGSPYERSVGFSRAVRVGDRVVVSGTAPQWPHGNVDPDPEVQTERCLAIMLTALEEAGASAQDVIRTRAYLVDAGDAEAVGRAHARVFKDIRPTSTMIVVSGFLDERWRVEMEAEAIIGSGTPSDSHAGPAIGLRFGLESARVATNYRVRRT